MAYFTTSPVFAESWLNPTVNTQQNTMPGYGPLSSSMNINPYQQQTGMFSNQYVQPQTQWGAPANVTGQVTSGSTYYNPTLPWYMQASNMAQYPFLPGYNQPTTTVTQPTYQQPTVATSSGGDNSFPTTGDVPEFQGWDALGNDLSNLFGSFSFNPGAIAGTIFGGPVLGMLGGLAYDYFNPTAQQPLPVEVDPLTGETIYPSNSYVDSSGGINWGDVSTLDPNYVDVGTYGYTTIDDIGVESPNYSSSDSSSFGDDSSGGYSGDDAGDAAAAAAGEEDSAGGWGGGYDSNAGGGFW